MRTREDAPNWGFKILLPFQVHQAGLVAVLEAAVVCGAELRGVVLPHVVHLVLYELQNVLAESWLQELARVGCLLLQLKVEF